MLKKLFCRPKRKKFKFDHRGWPMSDPSWLDERGMPPCKPPKVERNTVKRYLDIKFYRDFSIDLDRKEFITFAVAEFIKKACLECGLNLDEINIEVRTRPLVKHGFIEVTRVTGKFYTWEDYE